MRKHFANSTLVVAGVLATIGVLLLFVLMVAGPSASTDLDSVSVWLS